eukprot:m.174799 g.174799  ORF g.174799 m.174799 type:complete len:160 (+) comp15325_c4_seq10:1036-1515(+)
MNLSKLVFKRFDVDGSGTMSLPEFTQMCTALEHPLSAEVAKLAFRVIDVNGDGTVTYNEFSEWWKTGGSRFHMFETIPPELLATLGLQFRLFNVSGTGTISRAEAATLAATLNANGFPVGSPEYFVETIDSDRSGSISFKEYLEYMLARLNGLSAGPGS